MIKHFAILLVLFSLVSRAEASTRFYFSNDEAASVSPAYDASWTGTGSAGRWKLDSPMVDGTLGIGTTIGWATSTGQKHLDRQFVSAPLAAQTITGTVQCQVKTQESNADDNINQCFLSIRVCNNGGTAYTGTVLSLGHYGVTSEYSTRLANGDFGGRNKTVANADGLTDLAINDGDRLVVEIGHSNSVSGTTPNAYAIWGSNSAYSDYAVNETDTTDKNGWIQFSMDIAYQGAGGARRVVNVQ